MTYIDTTVYVLDINGDYVLDANGDRIVSTDGVKLVIHTTILVGYGEGQT